MVHHNDEDCNVRVESSIVTCTQNLAFIYVLGVNLLKLHKLTSWYSSMHSGLNKLLR